MVAYKYKTFDFLQKPLTKERFEETILRLYSDIFGSKSKYIRLDNDKTIIKENSIKFIKKDGMKLITHLVRYLICYLIILSDVTSLIL